MDIMYELPSYEDVESVTVTKECVDGTASPLVQFKDGSVRSLLPAAKDPETAEVPVQTEDRPA